MTAQNLEGPTQKSEWAKKIGGPINKVVKDTLKKYW